MDPGLNLEGYQIYYNFEVREAASQIHSVSSLIIKDWITVQVYIEQLLT